MRNVIIILITMVILGFMGASDYEAELKTQEINQQIEDLGTHSDIPGWPDAV